MSILKRSILQLGTTFMIVGVMAIGTFAMSSVTAFATNPACNNTVGISGGKAVSNSSCDVAIAPNFPGQIYFTADSTVTPAGAVVVGNNNFSFNVTVTDTRDTTSGWQLQAASTGLVKGTTAPVPINIAASSSYTCTPSSNATVTSCPIITFTSASLTSGPTTIVTGGTGAANTINAAELIPINGSYNVPIGATPGAYTGAITLSLLDTSL